MFWECRDTVVNEDKHDDAGLGVINVVNILSVDSGISNEPEDVLLLFACNDTKTNIK